MRQLYPGICSFFLWGLLLNRLLNEGQYIRLYKPKWSDKTKIVRYGNK
jgi:hypothetical protein